jgi:hypothetical protein
MFKMDNETSSTRAGPMVAGSPLWVLMCKRVADDLELPSTKLVLLPGLATAGHHLKHIALAQINGHNL